ncbi:hypothetical protein Tco_0340096 [Tanacetum coccineum]
MISRLDDMLLGVEGRSSAREDTVVRDLMAENKKLVKDIASLCELSRLAESPKKIIEDDTKSLRSRCRKFKENEVLLLATEASLKADLEEKDVLVSRGQALMGDLLAYHAKKSLGLLKSLKPPPFPLRRSFGVGPSLSPFI